ncbi:MAG: PEGA domain-containing protein, partial [Acidobacteriaceae bacterium]
AAEAELARRAEQQRQEQERIAQEKAEQERLAREKAEAERKEAERIAKARAEAERREQERLEQERIAKEKADAEARARQVATEQAIQQAHQLLVQEKDEQSLATLLAAMERDPASPALRSALDATRKEIAHQKAERERIAKERADREHREQEQLAREKAAAEQKERERLAKEQAQAEKKEKERLARIAREKADRESRESDRVAKEKATTEARARLAAAQQAKPVANPSLPSASPAAPAAAPKPAAQPEVAPAPASFLHRPRVLAGGAAGVLVLAVGLWFALRIVFAPAPMLQITVVKSPADAALTVDGQTKDCSANCALQLAPGNHTIALERPGYTALQSSLTLARTDAHRVVTLALQPSIGAAPPVPPPLPGSTLTILGDLGAAAVSLDGKPVGDLASGRVDLSQLAPGEHQVVIARTGKDLHLSIRIAQNGAVAINNATGFDQDAVIATTSSGSSVSLFCRCAGSELQIDGKRTRPSAHNTYSIPAASRSQFNLTLIHAGQSQNIPLQAHDPRQAMILIRALPSSPSAPPLLASQPPPSTLPAPTPASNPQSSNTAPATQPAAPAPAAEQHPSPATAPPGTSAPAPDLVAWNSISSSAQISDFQQFLKNYPESSHAAEARQRIAALQAKLEQQQQQQQQQQQKNQQDEKQILAALESYRTAYQSKDLNALSEIWLTVPRSDLQRTFKLADRIEVTLTPSAPVITGDSATITSEQRIVIVVHGKAVSQNSATILFSLEKIQGHWLIRTAK